MSIHSLEKDDKYDRDLEKRDSKDVRVHYEDELPRDDFYKRRSFHSSKTDVLAKYKRESWLIHKGVYDDDPGNYVDKGLQRKMKNRHIAMISIGGVIGTGLFLVSTLPTSCDVGPDFLKGNCRVSSSWWPHRSSFRLLFRWSEYLVNFVKSFLTRTFSPDCRIRCHGFFG